MSALIAAVCVTLAQLPYAEVRERAEALGRVELVKRVESALEQDTALLNTHRAFLSLFDDPEFAQIESAYQGAFRQREFQSRVADFEQTLQRAPEAERLFDAHNNFLHESPTARRAYEEILHAQLQLGHDYQVPATAYGPLLASPEIAVHLASGRSDGLPSGVQPLATVLRANPEAQAQLARALSTLWETPDAEENISGWWKMATAQQSEVAQTFERLQAHLAKDPHAFWIWQRRQVAASTTPESARWTRAWAHQANDLPDAGPLYSDYLATMARYPEILQASRHRWSELFGAPSEWPPRGAPPIVHSSPFSPPILRTSRPQHFEGPKSGTAPSALPRPSAPKPAFPTRPVRPERAQKPERPQEDNGQFGPDKVK